MKTLHSTVCVLCATIALSLLTSCGAPFSKIIDLVMTQSEDLSDISPADTVYINKTKTLDAPFSRIEMTGGYDIVLVQDSIYRLDFHGRKVFYDKAKIEVMGNTLYISVKEDENELHPERFAHGKYTIYVPFIEGVEVDGAADLKAKNFQQTQNMKIEINGAGDVEFKSSSLGNLDIEVNGSGDIELKSLLTKNIDININGAGDTEIERINADVINVEINGAGDISASGHCKDFKSNINGGGDVDIKELNYTK